jgi:hypothetical protein
MVQSFRGHGGHDPKRFGPALPEMATLGGGCRAWSRALRLDLAAGLGGRTWRPAGGGCWRRPARRRPRAHDRGQSRPRERSGRRLGRQGGGGRRRETGRAEAEKGSSRPRRLTPWPAGDFRVWGGVALVAGGGKRVAGGRAGGPDPEGGGNRLDDKCREENAR